MSSERGDPTQQQTLFSKQIIQLVHALLLFALLNLGFVDNECQNRLRKKVTLTGRHIMIRFNWNTLGELDIVDAFENRQTLTNRRNSYFLQALCIHKTQNLA